MNPPTDEVRDPRFQKEVRDRLRELVWHETPSGGADSLASFASLLQSRWEGLAITTTRFDTPAGPILIGDTAGSGWGEGLDPILLITHADTVWPAGTLHSRVPWDEADGIIHGPGVFDMKSGLVIVESVIRLLHEAARPHPPLRIFVAPDEETGSVHSAHMLKDAARGCAAALGFESPHPDGTLKIGRFGSTRLRVTVTGKEAHAALDPERGVSAIDELIDQLVVLRGLVEPFAGGKEPVLLNIGCLNASGRTNVVAASATAEVGLRFASKDREDDLLPKILGLTSIRRGAHVHVDLVSHRPAWAPQPHDKELGQKLIPAIAAGSPSRGAADTNMLAGSGIAIVDGLGAMGGGAHAVHEHIVEASMWSRIASLYEAFSDDRRWLRSLTS